MHGTHSDHLQPAPGSKERQRNLDVITKVGTRMIQEKKAAVLGDTMGGTIEKEDFAGNDLLTLLIRANLASNMPESMRMSDEEIVSQVSLVLSLVTKIHDASMDARCLLS